MMTCKYCGREIKSEDDVILNITANTGWHKNCENNTLGIHIEEIIDTQDLFG